VSEFPYSLAALRRFREQRGQVEEPVESLLADDDGNESIVPEDDDGDDFEDLFDAWVDFNMEVSG
jgi:hypothetical protein